MARNGRPSIFLGVRFVSGVWPFDLSAFAMTCGRFFEPCRFAWQGPRSLILYQWSFQGSAHGKVNGLSFWDIHYGAGFWILSGSCLAFAEGKTAKASKLYSSFFC